MNLKSKIRKNIFGAVTFVLVSIPTALVLAQTQTEIDRCNKFKKAFMGVFDSVPSAYCSATSLILMAINLFLTFAGIVTVLFLMIGGFWYLSAAGNEEQAETGKGTITNSVIGLAVIIMAYAIVRIISSLFSLGK